MIRVIIERVLKNDKIDEYNAIIRRAKIEATRKKGFMGGELYYDTKNGNRIMIIAAWDTLENWEKWDASEERQRLRNELSDLLEDKETVTVLTSERPN